MNQYLKYFIYFLLGVIIYYFLFNSTNAKSQKLIEGYTYDENDLPDIYINTGLTISQENVVTGSKVWPSSNVGFEDLTINSRESLLPTTEISGEYPEYSNTAYKNILIRKASELPDLKLHIFPFNTEDGNNHIRGEDRKFSAEFIAAFRVSA